MVLILAQLAHASTTREGEVGSLADFDRELSHIWCCWLSAALGWSWLFALFLLHRFTSLPGDDLTVEPEVQEKVREQASVLSAFQAFAYIIFANISLVKENPLHEPRIKLSTS